MSWALWFHAATASFRVRAILGVSTPQTPHETKNFSVAKWFPVLHRIALHPQKGQGNNVLLMLYLPHFSSMVIPPT